MSAAPVPSPRPDARVQTGIGWAPVLNVWLAHLPRLASGDAQVLSILYINAELHPPRAKGDTSPRPKFTRPITTEELAAYCRCTVRAIQTALEDLDRRKVIIRRKTGAGFMYGLPFGTWAELPDRPPAKPVSIVEPEQAEEDTDDVVPKKLEFELKKPLALKPGKRSRPLEMGGCAPGKFSVRNQSGADVAFSLMVVNGTADFVLLKASLPEANTKRSQTQSIASDNPQLTENTEAESKALTTGTFNRFVGVWLEHKVNAGPQDWKLAHRIWDQLPTEEQLAAVEGVRARFKQGEYDDPRFIPLPQNYLQKKLWMRPVRARRLTGVAAKNEEIRGRLERARLREERRQGGI